MRELLRVDLTARDESEFPRVFRGTLAACEHYAARNGYTFRKMPGWLFGGYFTREADGETLIVT